MCLKPSEERTYRQFLRTSSFPARLGVIPFTATNRSVYPINHLRNLAIDHVRTSHFWLTDMDMWPSRFVLIGVSSIVGLREALIELPYDQLAREDLAVIVPAFELHTKNKNVRFRIVAE